MANEIAMGTTHEAKRPNNNTAFLTVPELAQLLHDWLLENSHGGVMHDRLLIAGSDDRLVHHICNHAAIDWQQHALVSYSPSGTRHGLRMLDTGRVDACFIHWGASEDSARRHLGLLRCYRNHASWVIVRCLRRNQGLLLNKQEPAANEISQLVGNSKLRWAMRQNDSGTERLLEDLCSTHGQNLSQLTVSTQCNSELSAAAAVNTGVADVCCGLHSTAREFNLGFINAAEVSLDLVMTRQSYFRTLMQEFIKRMHDHNALDMAKQLGGYCVLPEAELVSVAAQQ